ncbi:MAG: histidine kinase [Acidobacteria bacterium]|nr:histidine kinase [Acidobacteriota bacterium]MCL5288737.1 histidine kinase [Acidobacteriota bacterium]
MIPHATERRELLRQVTLARLIFLVMACMDLLDGGIAGDERVAIMFVAAYLGLAVLTAILDSVERWHVPPLPLWVDLLALSAFLFIAPTVVGFWFLYLLVAFAAGIRWDLRRVVVLAGVVTFALLVRTVLRQPLHWPQVVSWVALAVGTFAAGIGAGFLGSTQRRHAAEHDLLARLSGMLKVEQGMAESVRQILVELARVFSCEEAVLVYSDADLERIFIWRARHDEARRIVPESLPSEKGDAYLLDDLNATVCWNLMEGPGEGFGWNRRDGRALLELPRMPEISRAEMRVHSLMAATFESHGEPAGRLLLLNGRKKFTRGTLRWLERITRQLGPGIENLFLLRQIRVHAIETERGRIAHDLHDGILQTLLSFLIQLDVLRRKLPDSPDRVATELAGLQQTLRHESEELRRLVTDLRPLRVQSADLVDLMRGFGDRFRHESGVALDLLADSLGMQVPDRVCRELFQIYREALHNIKKHANATHVVVKLWQQEDKVILVVDDNGQGFSFAGRFSSDELDRLRLGPISIKERTRTIGGVLTVESNPGHGARVTVEVPLS